MGYLKRAQQQTRALENSRASLGRTGNVLSAGGKGGRVKVGVRVSETPATVDLLKAFPIELRLKVLTKSTRAAGHVVAKAARANARSQSSRSTKTRAKWSQSEASARGGEKHLSDTITVRVKTYKHRVLSMTGHRRRTGTTQRAHLEEFEHWQPLWRQQGQDNPRDLHSPARPYLRPAGDMTKPQQSAALVRTMKKEWVKI